jgi:selenide,water dikinase
VLRQIIGNGSDLASFDNLLVSNAEYDDAAVWQINAELAMVSTADFFTPLVDDPFHFGRISAANALSDVYAMGGQPVMALALLGWPVNELSPELAARVMEGGRSTCAEAGIPLAGGHSIDSPEPFFGLAVSGTLNPAHVKRNHTARQGDLLFLTKPLGTGVYGASLKRDALPPEAYDELIYWTTRLNALGAVLGKMDPIHALTDVTGFGLLGHLQEMCSAGHCTAEIEYHRLPRMNAVAALLNQNMVPDATYKNWNAYGHLVKLEKGVPVAEAFKLLPDPQTNGGLLVALHPAGVEEFVHHLNESGLQNFAEPIGKMTATQEWPVRVLP